MSPHHASSYHHSWVFAIWLYWCSFKCAGLLGTDRLGMGYSGVRRRLWLNSYCILLLRCLGAKKIKGHENMGFETQSTKIRKSFSMMPQPAPKTIWGAAGTFQSCFCLQIHSHPGCSRHLFSWSPHSGCGESSLGFVQRVGSWKEC